MCTAQVKKNELLPLMKTIVRDCKEHVSRCEVFLYFVCVCMIGTESTLQQLLGFSCSNKSTLLNIANSNTE